MAGKQITPPPQAAVDTFASTSYWWLFRQLMDSAELLGYQLEAAFRKAFKREIGIPPAQYRKLG